MAAQDRPLETGPRPFACDDLQPVKLHPRAFVDMEVQMQPVPVRQPEHLGKSGVAARMPETPRPQNTVPPPHGLRDALARFGFGKQVDLR